jgi:hypothetical protein
MGVNVKYVANLNFGLELALTKTNISGRLS